MGYILRLDIFLTLLFLITYMFLLQVRQQCGITAEANATAYHITSNNVCHWRCFVTQTPEIQTGRAFVGVVSLGKSINVRRKDAFRFSSHPVYTQEQ